MRFMKLLMLSIAVVGVFASDDNSKEVKTSEKSEETTPKSEEKTKQPDKRGIFDFGYGDRDFSEHNIGSEIPSDFEQHSSPQVITKTVHVPQPYPVHVDRPVAVPVKIHVDRPYPVEVPKPYPVTVEKFVPYKVDNPVPYPVNVPVKIPVIHKVEVPVPKPYPVPVDKPYPVPVPHPVIIEKKVPVFIHQSGNSGDHIDTSSLLHGLNSNISPKFTLDAGHDFSEHGSHSLSSEDHESFLKSISGHESKFSSEELHNIAKVISDINEDAAEAFSSEKSFHH